jgi:hypothetical protein
VSWQGILRADSTEWLLSKGQPWVRYRTLRERLALVNEEITALIVAVGKLKRKLRAK